MHCLLHSRKLYSIGAAVSTAAIFRKTTFNDHNPEVNIKQLYSINTNSLSNYLNL